MDSELHYSLTGIPLALQAPDHISCAPATATFAGPAENYRYHQFGMEARLPGFYRDYSQQGYPVSSEDMHLHEYLSRNNELASNGMHSHFSPIIYPAETNPWQTFDTAFQMGVLPNHLQARTGKQKRARMSLQKRLLVNARERERMRVLNKAFEALRDALPCYIADGHMAKITTLRLAINYIRALTEVLNEQKSLEESKKELAESAKSMCGESADVNGDKMVQGRSGHRALSANSITEDKSNAIVAVAKVEKSKKQELSKNL